MENEIGVCSNCGSKNILGKFISTKENYLKYIEYCETCKKEFEVDE